MQKMNINRFFTAVLGAQLKNSRWSWGAKDPLSNRIYLRVWADQIEVKNGAEWVRIGYGQQARRSNGYAERNAHIDMIRAGVDGYGVVCVAKPRVKDQARKIASFDDRQLVRLGAFRIDGEDTYAKIDARVSVLDLARPTTAEATLADDLRAIGRMTVDATTKERLVHARIGQGMFRSGVLKAWGGRCAVTGIATTDALRASHIKPWRDSTNEERLDPENGVPLVANLDALFDAGLICFADDGEMMVSAHIDASEREMLGLENRRLRIQPTDVRRKYLQIHRIDIFGKRAGYPA